MLTGVYQREIEYLSICKPCLTSAVTLSSRVLILGKTMRYSEKFKKQYNVDFGKEYIIHHIDGNHNNDDINNLMILPRGLHSKYHLLKSVIDNHALNTTISGNSVSANNYYLTYYEKFIEVLHECNKWLDFTRFLAGEMPNIHNIKL